MKLSLLALAPLAAAGGGARGAISETLTDKLRDQGLPVAINFLSSFKVPDLASSWGIWSYGVKDIALSNIGADADIALSPVNGAAGAVLTLSNLKLAVQARRAELVGLPGDVGEGRRAPDEQRDDDGEAA